MTDIDTDAAILRAVLDRWQAGIAAHDPRAVAANFTEDAIFQGLHPYSVGPDGVAAYYDVQPVGMTVAYTLRETRRLAEDVVLGYLTAAFSFTDRPTRELYLGVVLRRTDAGWRIAHYQVSRLD
ncbi:SgcJ/EcaC family oxidoreductase [Catellatospora sp. NPDC049609]|uniref:YybH family protein n=1 Tax=Catellatospora sp. NPDC049609 TaxID=3155505 RepID=UPI003448CE8E